MAGMAQVASGVFSICGVIYPRKGDGQDAATGASSTAQAGREILGKLTLASDLHCSKSGALCVCWFLFLRRFLVGIWVGFGWGRGVSW